jgi:3-methyladenine DNA glycosylase AlkD
MPHKQPGRAALREIHRLLVQGADTTYRIGEVVSTRRRLLNVRVPEIRKLVREYAAGHPLTLDDAIQLLDQASRAGSREEVLFAIFLLARFRRFLSRDLWQHVERWVDALDNWETCDQLAMTVVGEVVATDLSLIKVLSKWTKSPNPWRRRAALASTTALNQKGRTHPTETLQVCKGALNDPDPSVQKAVSWALREVARNDQLVVVRFLRAQKDAVSANVLRGVAPKLSAEYRRQLAGG